MKRILYILIPVLFVGVIYFLLSIDYKDEPVNIIVLATPVKDSEVSSPLSVAGRARGSWFFEGSFPLVIEDSYGNVIAESHAIAVGAWTTQDFVKFAGTLQFNNYIRGSKATLILKKDNPSGLVSNDDSIRVPIFLK